MIVKIDSPTPLDSTPPIENTEERAVGDRGGVSVIRLVGVDKSYLEGDKTRVVLRGADCDIPAGEFTALLGRSGSGKSTLLNLISGIDRPDQGSIFLLGQEITAMTERDRTLFRRENIGFIFQFFNLLPTLTAQENVSLPLELAGVGPRQAQQQALDMLAEVGLADRGNTFPDRLSGGEQQRVAIARALVHNPPIILADEPTGNLDENTGRDVMDLLMRLTRERGHNLVMVTHSHKMAALADRLLRVHEGRLQPELGISGSG